MYPLLDFDFLASRIVFIHPRPPRALAGYYMEKCDSCAIREAFRNDLVSIGTDPPHLAYILFVPEGLTQQQTINNDCVSFKAFRSLRN